MKVPKLGLMLVGWGGNNGSTMTAAVLANKLKLLWETKEGLKTANWYVLLCDMFIYYTRLIVIISVVHDKELLRQTAQMY